MIAIITVHGIGFQQPPSLDGKVAGYADSLHHNLRQVLQGDLGDDPERLIRGQHGPVYVQSNWPPFEGPTEDGVKRLGAWSDPAHTSIDANTAPPLISTGRVAHVALVYSGLEEQQWDPAALLPLGSLALPVLNHYASVRGVIHMAIHDLEGILHHKPGPGSGSPSLSIRSDRPNAKIRVLPDQPAPAALVGGLPGASVLDAVKQVEDDVGGYVARNELRERVRVFVAESIARVCARTDVEQVILNTHSNGTVMGFDALKAMDPLLVQKTRAFVTAGSPLRKYVSHRLGEVTAVKLRPYPGGSTSGTMRILSRTRSIPVRLGSVAIRFPHRLPGISSPTWSQHKPLPNQSRSSPSIT